MIAVNDLSPLGTLTTTTEGWMVRMFMDPGRFGSPSITLGFSIDGVNDVCRSTWDVDTYVQGEWAMDDLIVSRLQDQDPEYFDRLNYRALVACETKERPLLFSMKFRSWKRAIGFDHLSRKESGQMPKSSRMSMRAIFNAEDSYTLIIWFKAPYDAELFQRNCLGLFTKALAARNPPLYGFVDDSGERFRISRNMGRKKYFASTEDQKFLAPKASAASDFQQEGEPDESTNSTGDIMEVEPTRQSPDLGLQTPQPTSGTSLSLPANLRSMRGTWKFVVNGRLQHIPSRFSRIHEERLWTEDLKKLLRCQEPLRTSLPIEQRNRISASALMSP